MSRPVVLIVDDAESQRKLLARILERLDVELDQVDYPRRRATGTTMEELLTTWYQLASPHWAPNTRRHEKCDRCALVPRFGHLAVGKVTTVDLGDFYADLLVRGGHDGKPLKPPTVRRIHGVLRRALTQAVRWKQIWDNLAVHARWPRVDQCEIYSPPPKAVAQLVAAASRLPGLAMYVGLAATTGARRGQVLALRWSDVDLDRGAIAYSRSVCEEAGGALVIVPTKNRRRNRVELDPGTVALLADHRVVPESRADAAGVALRRDSYVFSHDADADADADGDGVKSWRPDYVSKQFCRLRREAGLDGHRLHDLRHFMATDMIHAGVPIPIVAARLAHARPSTTMNVYAHAVPGGARRSPAATATPPSASPPDRFGRKPYAKASPVVGEPWHLTHGWRRIRTDDEDRARHGRHVSSPPPGGGMGISTATSERAWHRVRVSVAASGTSEWDDRILANSW